MAANNSSEKTAKDEVDLTSISSILDVMLGVFSGFATPLNPLPTLVVMGGKRLRPGMSARNLTSRIVSALSEEGLQMGDVFSDGPNREVIKIKKTAEKIVEMIQTEALVDVAIDIGAIQISSTGTAAGIFPVIAQGANLLPVGGGGGIR
jgi:hypothetical protein